MKSRLVHGCRICVYYLSWGWFMGVGLVLSLFCAPFLLLPSRQAAGSLVRSTIRALFKLWLWWLRFSGYLRITWRGFEVPLTKSTVYIANHPTLLDATFLLARLPDAVCIFKPALLRNPAIGPAAITAGYVVGDTGVDLIRDAAGKVAAGCSLLIFPEGTRTRPGATLGPLKPGYALIAERARAPVQLVVIRASPGLVPRGTPWWRPPALLPAWVEIALDRRWEYDPARPTVTLTAEIERRLSEILHASC